MKPNTDVLIVGAGPVGLFLAAALSRDGLDVLLIERMAGRSYFCKALGITARTMELFDDFGIAQDAADAGIWLRGVTTFNDNAPGPSMELPPGLPFGNLSLAQFEAERILEDCLARHGGHVQYGWTLAGFVEEVDGIRAELLGPGAVRQTVRSRFIIGCDGAHSTVRKTLGLDFAGDRFPQTFVLADLELHWPLERGRFYRFNVSAAGDRPATTLAAVPVAGSQTRYRLSTVLPDGILQAAEGERPAAPTLEEVRAFMTPLLPPDTILSEIHWSSIYRVSHRLVSSYSRGRAFLAGDAAHLHPPVGGQGMNTGLQDAYNLAWKLSMAVRGTASVGLLDSYSTERRAVGLDLVENTSRALHEALSQHSPMPGMRETQLLVGYRDSPIVRDDRPLPDNALPSAGDRAPNAGGLRRIYIEQPFRLHERLGRGRHCLIGYASDESELTAFVDLARKAMTVLGDRTSSFAIIPKGSRLGDRESLPILCDAEGEFAANYSAAPGMCWLVRPDGYLGWVSASPTVNKLAAASGIIAKSPIGGKG